MRSSLGPNAKQSALGRREAASMERLGVVAGRDRRPSRLGRGPGRRQVAGRRGRGDRSPVSVRSGPTGGWVPVHSAMVRSCRRSGGRQCRRKSVPPEPRSRRCRNRVMSPAASLSLPLAPRRELGYGWWERLARARPPRLPTAPSSRPAQPSRTGSSAASSFTGRTPPGRSRHTTGRRGPPARPPRPATG
jgi:hypothetical protein